MYGKTAVLVIVLAAACGCATGPAPRYYTLDMQPTGSARPACNIEIARLRSSEALARNDIMIKKTATEIEYYAAHRWAADPGELVREKLQTEFGRNPEAEKTIVVSGDLLGFEQADVGGGAEARVKLDLEFRSEDAARNGPPILRKTYEATKAAERKTPEAVVEALSRALEDVAAAIVADAGAL